MTKVYLNDSQFGFIYATFNDVKLGFKDNIYDSESTFRLQVADYLATNNLDQGSQTQFHMRATF